MQRNLFFFILMMIVIPIAGELKFYPFNDTFRVSFSIPLFFFFLLWIRQIHPIISGLSVGLMVVVFRMMLDGMAQEPFQFDSSLQLHFPAFCYYVIYAGLFYIMRINHYHHRPLLVGLLGAFIEIIAGMAELSIRYFVLEKAITLSTLGKLVLIAIIRSFFVLGFFNIIQFQQEQKKIEEQQKIMLISHLYEETIHLKKLLQHTEDITRDCYELYKNLKNEFQIDHAGEFAQRVLRIAGQVHEVKKDNQRIYAGLSKMISNESVTDYMKIEELGNIIVQTNQKVSRLFGKEIQFSLHIEGSHPLYHVYTTLSLINNLVANAVESIQDIGEIRISIYRDGEWVEFQIFDNGPGIPEKNQPLLFKLGFTTKYDLFGKPSTGIGLTYVKEVVETLNGEVQVQSHTDKNETVFIIRLPVASLSEKR